MRVRYSLKYKAIELREYGFFSSSTFCSLRFLCFCLNTFSPLCLCRELNTKSPLKFVHSAFHGVGHKYVQLAFRAFGFPPPIPVPEQKDPDPEFSTLSCPNPEEGESVLVGKYSYSTISHDWNQLDHVICIKHLNLEYNITSCAFKIKWECINLNTESHKLLLGTE